MVLVGKRQGCKIVIHGRDKSGKNTSRGITIADCTVEDVEAVVLAAIKREMRKALAGEKE